MPRIPARFHSRAGVPDGAAVASGTHGGTFEFASFDRNSRISAVRNLNATGLLLIRGLLALLTRSRMAPDVDWVDADAVFQCDRS